MSYIKNIAIIVVSSVLLYYFKLYSVRKGLYLFHEILVKNNIVSDVKKAYYFEALFYLIGIFFFYLLFKVISKYYEIDKVILLIFVISPLLFELSSIIYDKSCDKPWCHIDKLLWYLPSRLLLWVVLYLCFKDLLPMLKIRRNLIIIGCVFLIFHVFKIYSRYNF